MLGIKDVDFLKHFGDQGRGFFKRQDMDVKKC